MGNMKFKVGDRVRIKSLDWYNNNINAFGTVCFYDTPCFIRSMKKYCDKVMTITEITNGMYRMKEDNSMFCWTDKMIECLVKEETKPKFKDEESKKEVIAWMPNGKLIAEKFNDGTTTTIIDKFKYSKISINSEFCDDKVELVISPDFELKQEDNKWFAVKKNEYPKTYEKCCKILGLDDLINMHLSFMDEDAKISASTNYHIKTLILLNCLIKLLICRDAYWKIAGEEMGLGKPWEPDWKNSEERRYCIVNIEGDINLPEKILTKWILKVTNKILVFPSEETRDAFYENFKGLIEQCKEIL